MGALTRAVMGLSVLALLGGCPEAKEFKGKKNPRFLVIGHRGAPNVAAENTIASMEAAVAAGANALEIDLVRTADGEVVLWHDLDPRGVDARARRSGIEGLLYVPIVPPPDSPDHRPVDELSLATFLAGHGYSRTVGGAIDPAAPIALWQDFASWLAAESSVSAVYLDVKTDRPDDARAILSTVYADLSRFHRATLFAMSPRRAIVEAMIAENRLLPRAPFEVVWDFEGSGSLEGAEELGLAHVSTGLTVTRGEGEFLDDVEALLGAREDRRIDSVTVWTIDRRMLMGILLYYGVDGVMTNEPGALHDLWQRTL